MSDCEISGEKSPLLDSQTHRESGSTERGQRQYATKRSFVSSCGYYCFATATLPLVLFRRKKSDEVCGV